MAHPLCCEQVNSHCRNPSSRTPVFPVGSPSCGPMTHGYGPPNFLRWEVGLSATTSKSTPFPTRSQAWSQNLLDSRVVPRARCLFWTVRALAFPAALQGAWGAVPFTSVCSFSKNIRAQPSDWKKPILRIGHQRSRIHFSQTFQAS